MTYYRSIRTLAVSLLLATAATAPGLAQTVETAESTNFPKVQIQVNSAQDGPITPDDQLTLREAIAITNGTLTLADLSATEQQQITPSPDHSVIAFDLPAESTTIKLQSLLPALAQPGLSIDGTTQPGYDATKSATAEILVAIPVVEITPADNAEVFRGLTLVADDITIRGLSLYGFTSEHRATESTPPADIFIAHELPPPDISQQYIPASDFSFYDENQPPKGIVIEQNWIGIPTDNRVPEQPSAFGVSVFNAQGVRLQQNRIAYHDGSGVITGARAENLEIIENLIVNNGLAGMPDAIRLEGRIDNGLISGNLMCGNDGSGIFLFKPQGAVKINNNDIRFNGQRLRRAAIYLMGNDHQVVDNTVANQKGPGVVVTAFSQGGTTHSQRNIIENNRFENIEGLSIDLNTRRNRGVQDFQRGDGPNPLRDSHNRRRDTGNSAINSPQFDSPEFFALDNQVVIQGKADIGSTVQLYLTRGNTGDYGPLTTPLATVNVSEDGTFTYNSADLRPGDVISGISTDPDYGTSEPALNTTVVALGETTRSNRMAPASTQSVQCTTPPEPPASPEPPTPEPEVIRLEVPRNVHYGLDEDFINSDSAVILDQIAAVMEQYPSIVVDLHGHTDSRASVAYNQDLARRRANNARRYLMQQGIAPERMTIRSFGETQLRVEETDRVNYARNRRVEFVFSDVRGVDITFVDQEEDLQIEP
ncbi:OmpA family protein [Leptolyngbya cf. ectocarpi LEGE 11479]|uniref:OmpA family protein n=1 Tax=Leptolyngbya cf. ectocarpi LEGE 11479 TaxID=1828722 RepID=A0A928X1Z0_LEPEC|nr:OmpA family protein [Leptolyngbya ectocarpi]MBE9066395.1 OmpA family protein [Leptolyngbya cf. ectocarpi LEGE 11479]